MLSTQRNAKLMKPQSFLLSCKKTYPTFALTEHIVCSGRAHDLYLPRQFTNILVKDHSGQKAVTAFAFKTCRNMRDTWTTVSQHGLKSS